MAAQVDCSAVYKSGKKKGQNCVNRGKYQVDGKWYCGIHSRSSKASPSSKASRRRIPIFQPKQGINYLVKDEYTSIVYIPNFLSTEEQARHFKSLNQLPWKSWKYGPFKKEVPRETIWVLDQTEAGDQQSEIGEGPYKGARTMAYTDLRVQSVIEIQQKMEKDDKIRSLNQIITELEGIPVTMLGTGFEFCILNRYRNGKDSIAAHRDYKDSTIDSNIFGISIGADRSMIFRELSGQKRRIKIRLEAGSLYGMLGHCQSEWTHEIPKESRNEERISLTYRINYPHLTSIKS